MKKGRDVFLVCTGLGRVKRGFESYTSELAFQLLNNHDFKDRLQVYSGKKIWINGHESVGVPNIPSSSRFIRRIFSPLHAFIIEQVSYFLCFLPLVIIRRPKCIYLGEYRQYCYLYKARKYLGLHFSLSIYTGGQVFPGLFDPQRDFIHHVTDVYLPNNYPSQRQFLIPHFVKTDFEYDGRLMQDLKKKAGEKKIALSIGLIDKERKRMDFLVEALARFPKHIFPIILGQPSKDTQQIIDKLEAHFGTGNYYLGTVNASKLGSFYAIADFFMLCSMKEPFGLVYLEALWHKLDVFCNDCAESRFVLQDKAIFLDMTSESKVGDFLEAYLKKDSKKENNAGHDYVLKGFSWDVLQQDYLRMFKTISS